MAGSNVPAQLLRRASISIGPISVNTLLGRVPLRELPRFGGKPRIEPRPLLLAARRYAGKPYDWS